MARLWVISAGSPIPAIVNCRYIGANGRQTDAKREAWIAAIARISGSIARVASGVGLPAHGRIDVEAIDLRPPRPPGPLGTRAAVGLDDGGGEAVEARVVRKPGLAEPDRLCRGVPGAGEGGEAGGAEQDQEQTAGAGHAAET